ncbi:hypothetical protein ACF1BP_13160 [Streptomyces sp. NPDC014735]|uniref:hypothetical protein n=1 Tax=unclassified Streptomyces TaxID=2593676 RepID=UPI0018FE4C98|nr:hypothetical protein [Streptomyces sp. CB01580]
MKSLLWIVLVAALAANVFASFGVPKESTQIVLSVVSGLIVIGSGTGLWMLRDRKEA